MKPEAKKSSSIIISGSNKKYKILSKNIRKKWKKKEKKLKIQTKGINVQMDTQCTPEKSSA